MDYNDYQLTNNKGDYNNYRSGYSDDEDVLEKQYKHEEEEEDDADYEEKKLSLYAACGLNTMNMFGTGPFITIPFVVAATDPPGPQALIGYALAAFACMNDSLIWAELGSMWPHSGGSYVYLRELYGRNRWGRLVAFLFVWQIMVSGPMECASGFIATAQYIAYIDRTYTYAHHSLIAFGMCVATVWALYREIDEVGTITIVLWAATMAAITFAIVAGFTTFDSKYLQMPDDAFEDGGKFFMSLGIAARFAVYDFTGYYDVNFVGTEVQNASKNIPIACVTTCCVVAMCFFLVDVAVIGSLEWDPSKGGYVELVTSGSNSANYIMALFCETHISRAFAIFFTIVVVITIFGSCFSFMIGLAQIPYTAAKDGYFYAFLAHEHETYKGLQDYSLLFVGTLSTIFCFCDLEIVIEGMLTMQLLLQFMGQGWGLIWYRYFVPVEEQEEASFSVPFFPIPNIIQLVIFGFIFLTTETYVFHGGAPLMEAALVFLAMGVVGYLLWAVSKGLWPFEDKTFDGSDEEELDHMIIAHDNYQDECKTLQKQLEEKNMEYESLKERTLSVRTTLRKKDNELNSNVRQLGVGEFKILSLTRKLGDVLNLISDKNSDLVEKEIELQTVHQATTELQSNIKKLNSTYELEDMSESDVHRLNVKQKYSRRQQIKVDIANWTHVETERWWQINLKGECRKYLHIVSDSNLTGMELLAITDEMLLDYGMEPRLRQYVLKKIRQLEAQWTESIDTKLHDRKADPTTMTEC